MLSGIGGEDGVLFSAAPPPLVALSLKPGVPTVVPLKPRSPILSSGRISLPFSSPASSPACNFPFHLLRFLPLLCCSFSSPLLLLLPHLRPHCACAMQPELYAGVESAVRMGKYIFASYYPSYAKRRGVSVRITFSLVVTVGGIYYINTLLPTLFLSCPSHSHTPCLHSLTLLVSSLTLLDTPCLLPASHG